MKINGSPAEGLFLSDGAFHSLSGSLFQADPMTQSEGRSNSAGLDSAFIDFDANPETLNKEQTNVDDSSHSLFRLSKSLDQGRLGDVTGQAQHGVLNGNLENDELLNNFSAAHVAKQSNRGERFFTEKSGERIKGTSGNDKFFVSKGDRNTKLKGLAGNDSFNIAKNKNGGNHKLWGGAGRDRFIVGQRTAPRKSSKIQDFNVGEDLLVFNKWRGGGLKLVQRGRSTSVRAGSGKEVVFLKGVSADELSGRDIRGASFSSEPPPPPPPPPRIGRSSNHNGGGRDGFEFRYNFNLYSLTPNFTFRKDEDRNPTNNSGFFSGAVENFTGSIPNGWLIARGFEDVQLSNETLNLKATFIEGGSSSRLPNNGPPIRTIVTDGGLLNESIYDYNRVDRIEYILTGPALRAAGIVEWTFVLKDPSVLAYLDKTKAVNCIDYIISNALPRLGSGDISYSDASNDVRISFEARRSFIGEFFGNLTDGLFLGENDFAYLEDGTPVVSVGHVLNGLDISSSEAEQKRTRPVSSHDELFNFNC